ncbi:uncharacterized protein FA14DRAFT_162334 [Meira miltonrushii]|uniref:Uncharacterized protein n=1 Tax=Meira miltonrushii TaxID=1280837 RepID=A0A316V3N4_9BASI|nr:uncharacterized protein FA14DRAFT_162334 [Meira miltonrushii]PWN32062.1 hypothetical protein FA14DRAFT_162334 [Meira miltonrushii]
MLATMRPAPIHATDSSSAQYASHQASTSSKSTNRSTQMNKPNGSARPRAKKDTPGTGKQLAPGLLSLSKPIDEFQDSDDAEKSSSTTSKKQLKKKKQVAASADPSSVAAPNASVKPRKKALAIDEIKADENQLSRSAPDSHSSSDWDMPQSTKAAKDANSNAALTWQQQLLNSQAPKSASLEKKKGGKKDKATNPSVKSKGSQAVDVSKNEASSALTWQQELFGSNNKARGPAFDVFADERDAMTFGGNASGQPPNKGGKKKQRQRADSLGDIDLHNNHNAAHGRPSKPKNSTHSSSVHLGANGSSSSPSSGPPTTPNKLAYAGPNFHNSPSPASLPVPKFLQSKNGGVVNGTGMNPSMSANATSNSSLFAREAQAQQQQQQQQFYQQPQPMFHHPPPPPYPPFAQYPHPGPYNHPAQHIDPNISISSHSSDEEQDASFSHSKSRYIRGVTAPPELPSTPLMNGTTGDESVNSVGNNRNETIENLLARMMRPGSD